MVTPHTPAFRRHALDLVRAGDQSLAKVALELGVSETTLRKWVLAEDERTAPQGRLVRRREIDSLARQVRALEIEIDLLKRATASPPALRGRRAYY